MNKKKIMAVLLSFAMLGSLVGIPVSAEENAVADAQMYEATVAPETTGETVEQLEDEPTEETNVEVMEEIEETAIAESIEAVTDENVDVQSFTEADAMLMATSLTGSGTSNSPYLIYSESDLMELSNSTDATFLGAYFQLQNDITLTINNWSPIGINTSIPFKGTFDGNGHKISNIVIPENSYSYAGLFGVVTGTIKNLGVSSDIAGGSTAGALAGYVNGGTVEYCYSSGAVSSTNGYTGGLIGYMLRPIIRALQTSRIQHTLRQQSRPLIRMQHRHRL